MNGAPRELAMADFAPSRRSEPPRFADRERREIIMQQEALLISPLQTVDELFVLARTECCDNERLCLTPGEQCRPMGSRQDADLREDRANGSHVTPVDADTRIKDVPPHDLGLQFVKDVGDLLRGEFCIAIGWEK